MEYINMFLTIGMISFFAALTPGPDFIVVTKNSMSGSRKLGLATAVGVGFGILTHVAYTLLGVAYVISKSILLFNII